jgi:agmatine/peptidylarginine deiminase
MKKVTELFLVYPDNFPSWYSSLCSFYIELYALIPLDIKLNIIVNNKKAIEKLKLKVQRPFTPILIEGFNEIWLRDFMGFPVNKHVIKPIFNPCYFSKINTAEKLYQVKEFSNQALDQISTKKKDLDLVWDGGNLISNGKIGFITDKIVSDNLDFSEVEILTKIEKTLKIKPIIVPTCINDTLGHTDGYMSFLTEDTICISMYLNNESLKHENEYLYRLREVAREENLSIIDIQDRPTEEKCWVDGESIESAKGCYINFLKLNNTIILPEFELSGSSPENPVEANKEKLKGLGYNVKLIDCSELSALGGVLHCISWEN